MSDYARREFERLKRDIERIQSWSGRCPDAIGTDAINQLAVSHRRMALTSCQYCGCDCRQFDWNLDKPSTCQVCRVTR